jgi:hypothetical protein
VKSNASPTSDRQVRRRRSIHGAQQTVRAIHHVVETGARWLVRQEASCSSRC